MQFISIYKGCYNSSFLLGCLLSTKLCSESFSSPSIQNKIDYENKLEFSSNSQRKLEDVNDSYSPTEEFKL